MTWTHTSGKLPSAASGAVDDNTPITFEDTNFVLGDSPASLDCNAALGRNATQFSIQNDGPGNFTVSISLDGSLFGNEKTVKSGEVYAIDALSIDTVRVTFVSNSSYRMVIL